MSSDLDLLARWRNVGARHSDEVVETAPRVLKGGRLGEQGRWFTLHLWHFVADEAEWAIREQLAIAALDLGQLRLATVRRAEKYGGSKLMV